MSEDRTDPEIRPLTHDERLDMHAVRLAELERAERQRLKRIVEVLVAVLTGSGAVELLKTWLHI